MTSRIHLTKVSYCLSDLYSRDGAKNDLTGSCANGGSLWKLHFGQEKRVYSQ